MKSFFLFKIITLSALSAIMLSSLTGCENNQPSSSTDANQKPLIMATEAGFAPYEYLNGQSIVGIDVDIANEIAKELNRPLQIANMEFDAIWDSVNTNRADFAAAGISITEDRKKIVDFSMEYATTNQVVMVLKDSVYQKASDLKGKTIAVQQGTVSEMDTASYIPEVKILPSKKYFEAVSNLVSGRADAIVLDKLPAQELLQSNPNLKLLDETLFTDSYAFCVKKGNTELLTTINNVLQRLKDEGKLDLFTKNHQVTS